MLISKEYCFCASHVLPRHPGKCSRLHGHNFMVRVELDGPINPQSQFVLDYGDFDTIVEPIINRFDHRHLNAFVKYPSAENISAHLAHLIRAKLNVQLINRLIVAVSETPKTWAIWDSNRKEDVLLLDRSPDDAEWRSPNVKIPLTDLDGMRQLIQDNDHSILHLLTELNAKMSDREQYALYLSTLSEPTDLPAILSSKDVQ